MGIPAFFRIGVSAAQKLQLKNVWIALPSSVHCTITTSYAQVTRDAFSKS